MQKAWIESFQSTRPHGARPHTRPAIWPQDVFQSTRPHGARRDERSAFKRLLCFNPRAHTGRDDMSLLFMAQPDCFNPRAHTGRDSPLRLILSTISLFQSTRPHGARRICSNIRQWSTISFNPRAHTGRDVLTLWLLLPSIVSIHAPTRGATFQKLHGQKS